MEPRPSVLQAPTALKVVRSKQNVTCPECERPRRAFVLLPKGGAVCVVCFAGTQEPAPRRQ